MTADVTEYFTMVCRFLCERRVYANSGYHFGNITSAIEAGRNSALFISLQAPERSGMGRRLSQFL